MLQHINNNVAIVVNISQIVDRSVAMIKSVAIMLLRTQIYLFMGAF